MSTFGNTNTGSTTPGQLFGNAANNAAAGSNNANAASPASSLFGAPAAGTTQATGLFGGARPAGSSFGNTQTTTTPTAGPSGGLFGNNNAAGTTPGTSLFGQPSVTQAAPSNNLFGSTNTSTTQAPSSSNLFGGTNTGTTPAAASTPGNFFGAPTPAASTALASTATNTPPASNLFSSFAQSKPAEQKPAPSLFSLPTSTASTTTTQPATATGSLFGAAKPSEASAPGASGSNPAPASTRNLFSGGGLFSGGAGLPANTTPNAPATASTTTLPSFSLGGNKGATASSTTPAAGTSQAIPPTAGSLFSLGGTSTANTSKPEEKKNAAASAPAFSLFGAAKTDTEKKDIPTGATTTQADRPKEAAATGSAAPATSAPTATASAISVPPPSMLRGKTIEEIVNRWTTELETQVREFNQFATEVSVWDRALIENSNNLAALYAAVLAAEREQTDIDQSLDHIEQQQKELSTTLEAYERLTDEILGSQGGSLRALDTGPADTERDKNYMLATELHGHLDDLSASLTQMIESVNELSLAAEEKASDDPMGQIAEILSSHLESLQWIDGAVRETETKVGDVEKRIRASEGASASFGGAKSRGLGLAG